MQEYTKDTKARIGEDVMVQADTDNAVRILTIGFPVKMKDH